MVQATTICNTKKDFLHRQTRDWLIRQMRTGKLKPGSKLPGERALAEQLKISRGTARNALQQLEEEGLIERIPSRGAFIRQEKRAIRLALVFPEASISRECLHYANWMASYEMQNGLIEAGVEFNSELSFVHCRENDACELIAQRLSKDFDGAVFTSWQLRDLKIELKKSNFPFLSMGGEDDRPTVVYNRTEMCLKAARYIWDCGCRSVILLSSEATSISLPEKEQAVSQVFKSKSNFKVINVAPKRLALEHEEDVIYENLKNAIPNDRAILPDAFFCTTPVVSFALLRLANERQWNIPKDFMVMGYANDMKIRPTTPLLTHVHIPYYEIGKTSCRLLANKILNNMNIPESTIVPAELIIGQSTINL